MHPSTSQGKQRSGAEHRLLFDYCTEPIQFVHFDFFSSFISRLDGKSGQLYMRGRLPEGVYDLKINVHDSVWKRDVTSTVSITLKDIPERAVRSSGSIRLQG